MGCMFSLRWSIFLNLIFQLRQFSIFFMKISCIRPWVNKIDWFKGCGLTNLVVRLSKRSPSWPFWFFCFISRKQAARSYKVAFISAQWMVSSESWKRLHPNFYAHNCMGRGPFKGGMTPWPSPAPTSLWLGAGQFSVMHQSQFHAKCILSSWLVFSCI